MTETQNEEWEEASIKNGVLVNGVAVDPTIVGVGADNDSATLVIPIEIHIRSLVVLHELECCDVPVSQQTLASFVKEDLRTHGVRAREAYLGMIRPTQRRRWFGFLLGKQPAVVLRWLWIHTLDVIPSDDVLVLKGECVEAAEGEGNRGH